MSARVKRRRRQRITQRNTWWPGYTEEQMHRFDDMFREWANRRCMEALRQAGPGAAYPCTVTRYSVVDGRLVVEIIANPYQAPEPRHLDNP